MAHTAMLMDGGSLSNDSTIGNGLSTRTRTSALLMTYSHQVWDASNSSKHPADPVGSGSPKNHVPEHGLLAAAAIDLKHHPESLFAIRDSIQSRKSGRL